MRWHTRYAQQANWTRDLRTYIFEKIDLREKQRVLEVGCGTGAILAELPRLSAVYGLDVNQASLAECRVHAPGAFLIQGNALSLPFPDNSFDVVYSHFLLLWVGDPLRALREMRRVARSGGYVIAFAEPDYMSRVDKPEELSPLGSWQAEALRRQGADPSLGARVAELFFKAEIRIIETGTIQNQSGEPSPNEWEIEWAVIESDLTGIVPDADLQKMKLLDQRARERGTRVLHVPTHFAWGTK